MNNTIRTIMVWLVIGVILTMVFMQVGNRTASQNVVDYSTFMDEAQAGHIAKIKMDVFNMAIEIVLEKFEAAK